MTYSYKYQHLPEPTSNITLQMSSQDGGVITANRDKQLFYLHHDYRYKLLTNFTADDTTRYNRLPCMLATIQAYNQSHPEYNRPLIVITHEAPYVAQDIDTYKICLNKNCIGIWIDKNCRQSLADFWAMYQSDLKHTFYIDEHGHRLHISQ